MTDQCGAVSLRYRKRAEITVLTCERGIVYLRNYDLINYKDKKEKTPSFWPRYSVLLCEEKPYAAIPDMVLISVQDLSGIA